jgi:hypothetical protein
MRFLYCGVSVVLSGRVKGFGYKLCSCVMDLFALFFSAFYQFPGARSTLYFFPADEQNSL